MSSEAKVAYLRGLIDGCNLAQGDKNKEKFLAGLIDTLQTLTEEIQVLQDEARDTSDLLDLVSQDVLSMKQRENSNISCDCDDCDDLERNCDGCDGCTSNCDDCEDKDNCDGCEGCKKLADESSEEDNSDMEEFDQMTCPHCGEKFYFDATSYEDGDKLICPYCGKTSVYSE
ncbi:MAG: hypothetical protein Q4C78_02955 [Synergistaceae bacterium]|nr:hypothetical protein [Synergistaceae bacterium]